ncbi:hypothetical protein OG317_04810 [Streptomyces sp. NBC_01167]|uniref:hypothetical protein n=1 Tax=Streptomyces sp. NBC_01167 TaxID=2903756 RepID=UPI00386B680B|nr:hypothetical protein OG317_04810 [Streptomyces sp. NBC_01167]
MRRPPRHHAPGPGGGDTMEGQRRAVRVTEGPEFLTSVGGTGPGTDGAARARETRDRCTAAAACCERAMRTVRQAAAR